MTYKVFKFRFDLLKFKCASSFPFCVFITPFQIYVNPMMLQIFPISTNYYFSRFCVAISMWTLHHFRCVFQTQTILLLILKSPGDEIYLLFSQQAHYSNNHYCNLYVREITRHDVRRGGLPQASFRKTF